MPSSGHGSFSDGGRGFELRDLGIMARFEFRTNLGQHLLARLLVFSGVHHLAEIVGEGSVPGVSDKSVCTGLVGPATCPEDMVHQSLIEEFLLQERGRFSSISRKALNDGGGIQRGRRFPNRSMLLIPDPLWQVSR